MTTTHDLLMKALRAYFEEHQKWEMKQTHSAGQAARAHLSEIRRLARIRRAEIQEIRHTKPKVKSPYYKAEQAAQNDTGTEADLDN